MKSLNRATAVLGAAVALAALAACDRGGAGTPAAKPDPSAQTINVQPAPPTGDPPGTTPVTGGQSDLTQGQSRSQMPLEGQNHNYSSIAPQQSQKSGSGSAPSEGDNAKGGAGQQGQQPASPARSQ
ncbi:MAG TPA: hypothetical protein VN782_17415 [Usitatibacter sp.]|nr:hypothetical protein [Usitatibacter sp.]